MKRFSRLYIIGFLWTSLSLSAQENILTSRVLREPVQKVSEVNDANSVTTIEYYDTAGRLIQTIRKGFGPNGEDLADYIQFDEAGRIAKEYLSTPFTGNNGVFVPVSEFEQSTQTWSRTHLYEASTEGRIVETSGMHVGGKSIKYDYRLSNSSEPELSALEFRMQNNTTINKRMAARGAYQVVEEIDEDGHRILLFTDSDGHTVLKRRVDGDVYHDTYMVYDAYDHLRCVLPPAAVDAYSSFDDQSLSAGNFLDLYAYFYIYDNDNQCVGVKYPGADWIYTVYDGDYRPILSQDGNQRKRDEWSFIKYDGLGRVVIEGIVKDKRTRDDLADIYEDVLVHEEYIGTEGPCRGYTDHIKMGQNRYILTCIRYYDNYAFTEFSSDWSFANMASSASAKGLLTGVFEAVLNQPDKGRFTINQYDDKSRLIRRDSKETLSNNTLSADYSYNFSGALIRSDSRYGNRYSLRLDYNYDHAGREKNSICVLGYGTTHYTSPLRAFTYDSHGRISEKMMQGNKVKMTYGYHNDGTLFNIGSMNGFNETLYFGNSMLPYQLSRCNNGNIADISISQGGRLYFYHFDYDGFDRLTSGMMYGVNGSRMRNDEFFDYDEMGNITSLLRLEESGSVNDLDIHYRGNQLLKVTDGNHSFPATYDFAIYPDLVDHEQEYYYDSNGNEIANLDKNIVATRYNILNLPDTVQFGNGNRIVNYYLSNGTKLGSVSRTYTTPLSVPLDGVTHSADPYVETTEWRNEGMHYKNGIEERVDIEDGYLQLDVNKTSGALNAIGYYAYICDHLGSIRQVCDAVTGDVVQSLEYYPSGLIFRSTNYDLQSNKYTGKELISMHGLNQYDSDARMQEFQIPHFTTRDPLCEEYYDISLYAYCANNPMRYVDPDGRFIGTAIGTIVGGIKGAYEAHKNGTDVWAGAAEGMVAGAITGAAVDLAVAATVATGGGALVVIGAGVAAGTVAGATGAIAGDVTGQVVASVRSGKTFSQAASNISTDNFSDKAKGGAISGAITGFSGGLLGVVGKAATSSTQAIQGTMSKNITTTAAALTEQSASEGTVTTVVSGITKGMGTVGANTTKSMMKVETVTSVATEASTKLIEDRIKKGGH